MQEATSTHYCRVCHVALQACLSMLQQIRIISELILLILAILVACSINGSLECNEQEVPVHTSPGCKNSAHITHFIDFLAPQRI